MINSSTSTLSKHLKAHGYFISYKQYRFTSEGDLTTAPIKPQKTVTTIIFSALCHCVVDAALSYSVVENEWFRQMIAICDKGMSVRVVNSKP